MKLYRRLITLVTKRSDDDDIEELKNALSYEVNCLRTCLHILSVLLEVDIKDLLSTNDEIFVESDPVVRYLNIKLPSVLIEKLSKLNDNDKKLVMKEVLLLMIDNLRVGLSTIVDKLDDKISLKEYYARVISILISLCKSSLNFVDIDDENETIPGLLCYNAIILSIFGTDDVKLFNNVRDVPISLLNLVPRQIVLYVLYTLPSVAFDFNVLFPLKVREVYINTLSDQYCTFMDYLLLYSKEDVILSDAEEFNMPSRNIYSLILSKWLEFALDYVKYGSYICVRNEIICGKLLNWLTLICNSANFKNVLLLGGIRCFKYIVKLSKLTNCNLYISYMIINYPLNVTESLNMIKMSGLNLITLDEYNARFIFKFLFDGIGTKDCQLFLQVWLDLLTSDYLNVNDIIEENCELLLDKLNEITPLSYNCGGRGDNIEDNNVRRMSTRRNIIGNVDGTPYKIYPPISFNDNSIIDHHADNSPLEVTNLYSTRRGGSSHEVHSNSSSTRRGASSTEVHPAVSSSNYLSLKSRATPGDRGGGEGSDGSSIMGMMEDGAKDVLDVTSSGSRLPETIYGSRGGLKRRGRLQDNERCTGPQVEPESDLRELEGEVNREAVCKTTSCVMRNSTGPQVEPVADLREAEGEVNRGGRLQDRDRTPSVEPSFNVKHIPTSVKSSRKKRAVSGITIENIIGFYGDKKPHNPDIVLLARDLMIVIVRLLDVYKCRLKLNNKIQDGLNLIKSSNISDWLLFNNIDKHKIEYSLFLIYLLYKGDLCSAFLSYMGDIMGLKNLDVNIKFILLLLNNDLYLNNISIYYKLYNLLYNIKINLNNNLLYDLYIDYINLKRSLKVNGVMGEIKNIIKDDIEIILIILNDKLKLIPIDYNESLLYIKYITILLDINKEYNINININISIIMAILTKYNLFNNLPHILNDLIMYRSYKLLKYSDYNIKLQLLNDINKNLYNESIYEFINYIIIEFIEDFHDNFQWTLDNYNLFIKLLIIFNKILYIPKLLYLILTNNIIIIKNLIITINTIDKKCIKLMTLRSKINYKLILLLLMIHEPHNHKHIKDKNIPHEVQSTSLPPEVQSNSSSTRRAGSPPEVQSTSLPLAESSSNYISLKSRATPRDRGGGEGGGEGSDGSSIMGMMEDDAKDVLDVTSSGKPVADLREAEGDVNREGCLQEEGKVITSGGPVADLREAKGEINREGCLQDEERCIGPQVVPENDLREFEGEVNRRATTASGKVEGSDWTSSGPVADLREAKGEVNRESSLQEEGRVVTSCGRDGCRVGLDMNLMTYIHDKDSNDVSSIETPIRRDRSYNDSFIIKPISSGTPMRCNDLLSSMDMNCSLLLSDMNRSYDYNNELIDMDYNKFIDIFIDDIIDIDNEYDIYPKFILFISKKYINNMKLINENNITPNILSFITSRIRLLMTSLCGDFKIGININDSIIKGILTILDMIIISCYKQLFQLDINDINIGIDYKLSLECIKILFNNFINLPNTKLLLITEYYLIYSSININMNYNIIKRRFITDNNLVQSNALEFIYEYFINVKKNLYT